MVDCHVASKVTIYCGFSFWYLLRQEQRVSAAIQCPMYQAPRVTTRTKKQSSISISRPKTMVSPLPRILPSLVQSRDQVLPSQSAESRFSDTISNNYTLPPKQSRNSLFPSSPLHVPTPTPTYQKTSAAYPPPQPHQHQHSAIPHPSAPPAYPTHHHRPHHAPTTLPPSAHAPLPPTGAQSPMTKGLSMITSSKITWQRSFLVNEENTDREDPVVRCEQAYEDLGMLFGDGGSRIEGG